MRLRTILSELLYSGVYTLMVLQTVAPESARHSRLL
jgi:hypothetical protein